MKKAKPVRLKRIGTPHGKPVVADDVVAEALATAGGRVSEAARKLGYSKSALYERIAASGTLKRAVELAREEIVDEAEASLRALIKAGDPQAVIFTLRTIGKKRGYIINEAPAVTVNTNVGVNTAGIGENPERQAKLKAAYDRIRESAAAERSGAGTPGAN